MDAANFGKTNHTRVKQYDPTRGKNQKWKITYLKNGYYVIRPSYAKNMALRMTPYADGYHYTDIYDFGTSNKASLSPYAQWTIVRDIGDSVKLINKQTELTANVRGNSKAIGASIIGYSFLETANQRWEFHFDNDTIYKYVNKVDACSKIYPPGKDYELTVQYMRRNYYKGTAWNFTAGKIDSNFAEYVKRNNNNNALFSSNKPKYIIDPKHGTVDVHHLAATINAHLYTTPALPAVPYGGDSRVNDLAGWAGDLQSLMTEAVKLYGKDRTYTTYYNVLFSWLGDEEHRFGMADVFADLDALYLAGNRRWSSVGEELRYYYSTKSLYGKRFTRFVNGRSKTSFRSAVHVYTLKKAPSGFIWPLLKDVDISSDLTSAAEDAFTDFIFKYKNLE